MAKLVIGTNEQATTPAIVIGSGGSGTINPLNVIPTTSPQTITASGGVDGYSPVRVGAVTNAIDQNITANNIKDGVTILGVTGNVVELNGETKTVTPQTYQQTIHPTSPKNAITEVNVNPVTSSIDANIVAGNIKKDVQILGVTGSYEGTTPSGTINITSNNTYDVTNYASAVVNVPGSGPSGPYIPLQVTNGELTKSTTATTILDLTGVTSIGQNALSYAYTGNTALSGAIDMSGVTFINSYGLSQAFTWCTNITSVDLSGLENTEFNALYNAFSYCTGLTTVDMSSLTQFAYSQSTFSGCTSLTSIDLSNVEYFAGDGVFYNCSSLERFSLPSATMFEVNSCFIGCESLIEVSIPLVTTLNTGSSLFEGLSSLQTVNLHSLYEIRSDSPSMFNGCFSLANVDFTSLHHIDGGGLSSAFAGCSSLVNISFPSLEYINDWSMGNIFAYTFGSCEVLETVDFAALERIGSLEEYMESCSAFTSTFEECQSLKSVSFKSLKTLFGDDIFNMTFYNISEQEPGEPPIVVSFYAINEDTFSDGSDQFRYAGTMDNMLAGCSKAVELHFPANMEQFFEDNVPGAMNQFGCDTGATVTILYDIQTEMTGTSGDTYARKERYSTSTATAWELNDTLYYTSGTGYAPLSGGEDIYSDPECTTQVDTVDTVI